VGAILLVVLLLLYLLSVYKRERVKKERRILLLQQQIQENENVLTTLQHDYIKRNKEIEDLSFRYAQNNESLFYRLSFGRFWERSNKRYILKLF
jgi:hypothetical protein